jgi:hypothetical protein
LSSQIRYISLSLPSWILQAHPWPLRQPFLELFKVSQSFFSTILGNVFIGSRIHVTMSNAPCNYTILQQDCTLQTCCLNQGTVNYIPTLAGSITYTAIFVLLLTSQLGLCLWYRTWTFMIGMIFGLICEILGYAGRIWMHYRIFDMNPFLM